MTELHSPTPTTERESGVSAGSLALAGVGIAAAGLLASRAAQAQASGTHQHVTLYYDGAAPSAGAVLVPNTSKNFPNASIQDNDVKVLNFAISLESLEAELYRQAFIRLTGTTFVQNDPNGTNDMFGNPLGSLGHSTTDIDALYYQTFGMVEMEHRNFLTAALGNNWVTDAGVKFDFSMSSLDRTGVINLVYAAEVTGISAFLGGITKFTDKAFLQLAAGILGTEARHTAAIAAVINTLAGRSTIETAPLQGENSGRDTPLTPDQILNQGGSVPAGITVGGTGAINPVSGPNGFVVM